MVVASGQKNSRRSSVFGQQNQGTIGWGLPADSQRPKAEAVLLTTDRLTTGHCPLTTGSRSNSTPGIHIYKRVKNAPSPAIMHCQIETLELLEDAGIGADDLATGRRNDLEALLWLEDLGIGFGNSPAHDATTKLPNFKNVA